MTQPPYGHTPENQPESGETDKTTVFRPGEYDFTPPPPPGQAQQPAYGQAAPQPYGTPPASPYGQPQPYAQPQPSPYGQPQPQPYGQQAQSGYGQQQQPAYGQQQSAYPQPGSFNYGARTNSGRAYGVVGAVLAVLGAAAVVVAFTAVKWYDQGSLKFNDIKDNLDHFSSQASFLPKAYYSWLGWVLLAAALVLALVAAAPTSGAAAARGLGLLVGLAGVGATLWAVDYAQGIHGAPSYSEFIKHAGVGFYLAAAGFLVIGIGAAIGPRRT